MVVQEHRIAQQNLESTRHLHKETRKAFVITQKMGRKGLCTLSGKVDRRVGHEEEQGTLNVLPEADFRWNTDIMG